MVALKRVLCPVDLSELSIHALACAGSIAEWYRSELTVLHVVPTFEAMEVWAGALFDPVQFVYPMTREQIEERLRDAVRAAGLTLDRACVAARAGEPHHVIVNEATEADLVVMATHGRRGWDRLMLGSVAEKVLRSAPCSVVTVRVGHKRLIGLFSEHKDVVGRRSWRWARRPTKSCAPLLSCTDCASVTRTHLASRRSHVPGF